MAQKNPLHGFRILSDLADMLTQRGFPYVCPVQGRSHAPGRHHEIIGPSGPRLNQTLRPHGKDLVEITKFVCH